MIMRDKRMFLYGLSAFFLLSFVNACPASPGRTIEKPMFGYATSDLFRVERIDLAPDSTVLHIRIP